MIKKIEREIQKLESQKSLKIDKRKSIDEEISNINMKLKELNLLKSQFEKLQNGAENLMNTL